MVCEDKSCHWVEINNRRDYQQYILVGGKVWALDSPRILMMENVGGGKQEKRSERQSMDVLHNSYQLNYYTLVSTVNHSIQNKHAKKTFY